MRLEGLQIWRHIRELGEDKEIPRERKKVMASCFKHGSYIKKKKKKIAPCFFIVFLFVYAIEFSRHVSWRLACCIPEHPWLYISAPDDDDKSNYDVDDVLSSNERCLANYQ